LKVSREKFKYDISGPDKVNAQIESGVDFFPDETSGATGFTPNIDLESRYHKYIEGPVVEPRTHDGTYYANLDPIANRGSLFINADGVYMVPAEGGNTLPPGGESGIPGFIEEQRTFNIGDHSLVNQPAGHSTNNPFQPDGPYNFIVEGVLKAQGTEQDSIIFDNYSDENWDENIYLGWKGFTLDNVTDETIFEYVRISGAMKYLSEGLSTPAWILIYGKGVATIHLTEEPICVVIKDEKVVKSYTHFFDIFWKESKKGFE